MSRKLVLNKVKQSRLKISYVYSVGACNIVRQTLKTNKDGILYFRKNTV